MIEQEDKRNNEAPLFFEIRGTDNNNPTGRNNGTC
jgi:hypothetical protein